ncbi:MAG: DUF86 domain-containing protein [Cyanobacteria bacterium P01_D01_bin.56]
MSRDLSLYLNDILSSIAKIKRFTANMSQTELTEDERTFDAVALNLQIIGEAVKNIPEDLRETYPQIEWRKIAGLRDFIAHAYFMIDDEIIWDVIQTKLQPLEKCVLLMKTNL